MLLPPPHPPCNILIPIHPRHAAAIYSGKKVFEFRKFLPRRGTFERFILYETAPRALITGSVIYSEVITDTKEAVWFACLPHAGISRSEFDAYYAGHTHAHAYRIDYVDQYAVPKTLADYGLKRPPQSHQYVPA